MADAPPEKSVDEILREDAERRRRGERPAWRAPKRQRAATGDAPVDQPLAGPLLDALDAIGAPDDTRSADELVLALEQALAAIESQHGKAAADAAREAKVRARLAQVERLKGALRERGMTEAPGLRREIGALRKILDIPEELPNGPDRVRARAQSGPLLHLATGFETLDEITRGGLLSERIAVIGGAPDAGKTSLAVQLGHHYARNGCAVVIHAVDEDREGIECRIGQAHGLALEELEARNPGALSYLADRLAELPTLAVVDQDEDGLAIEDSAALLGALAQRHGCAGKVLIVDSLQTAYARALASLERGGRSPTPKDRADVITRVLKATARKHKALVIVTSELARGAYRSKQAKDRSEPMASFKESGSIEYAMTIGLVLTTPRGEPGVVHVDVPKNKRGRRGVAFRLVHDGRRCVYSDGGEVDDVLDEAMSAPSPPPTASDVEVERARHVLRTHPGIAGTKAWCAAIGGSKARAHAACKRLADLGEVETQPSGRTTLYYWRDSETVKVP